ncbi:MAG: hypothetical protein ACNA7Y_00605, partial [Gammaproteobacteria bacterium]
IQCSIGWLLQGTGVQPAILNEASANKRQAIPSSRFQNNIQIHTAISREIAVFCESYPDALYIEVIDDGMEPYYFKGDYVAGKRYYREDIPTIAVGKYCIVETQMGDILLRHLRHGSKEGYYSLQCTNLLTSVSEPLLYDVELASAAPVIWHRRIM